MPHLYCLVENGQVIEGPQSLPKSWKNVSNPGALPDADLKKLGWYPVVDDKPDYDATTHRLGAPTLTVGTDAVTRTWPVETIPEPTPEQVLNQTDIPMIRVIEDLFDALKAKGVLADSDLPKEAVDRIEARKATREEMK